MKCANGTEAEFKIKIENRTEDGRYREKIKYEFRGEDLEVETEDEIDLEEETNGTEYKLRAKLRNGNFTNIKIMPDQASEIALERLKALNFTVQLRERLHNNVPQVVYNIDANKSGRFLGVFKIIMKLDAQIDPETGEILSVNAPWWAFLASQQDEASTGTGGDETGTNQSENNTGTNETETGVRAGLDFDMEITENGESKIVLLDFGNYNFDNKTGFQTREVTKEEGYIDLFFMKLDEQRPDINYSNVVISDENEFVINYYQVFRIKINQSVSLNDADIKIKLIDITGSGCPKGAAC